DHHSDARFRPRLRSRLLGNYRTRLVEAFAAWKSDRNACPVASLGRAHSERFTSWLWRLCPEDWQTLRLPCRRYSLFLWLQRNRTPPLTRTRFASDRRLQSSAIPQRACEPGGCDEGLSGLEISLDGSHALRHIPPVA